MMGFHTYVASFGSRSRARITLVSFPSWVNQGGGKNILDSELYKFRTVTLRVLVGPGASFDLEL